MFRCGSSCDKNLLKNHTFLPLLNNKQLKFIRYGFFFFFLFFFFFFFIDTIGFEPMMSTL